MTKVYPQNVLPPRYQKGRKKKKRQNKQKDDIGVLSLLAASLRHQTTEFFNNSTLHGVRYIAEKERPFCEKFMWFSFTAIGAVATCIIIVSLWEKFQTNPTITGLDTDFHNWDVPFPAVTICDKNPLDEELLQEYIDKVWPAGAPANATRMLQWLATLSFRSIEESATTFITQHDLVGHTANDAPAPALDPKEAVFSIVQRCEAAFYDCEWKGDSEECCDFLVPVFTEMGFCYAYNSRHAEKSWPWQSQAQSELFTEAYIHETDSKWSFMFNSFRNTSIIDIYIHSTEEMAGLEQSAQLSWDHRVEKVSFSVKHTYTTEDARQLSIRQRRCIFADEVKLETSSIYTYSACMRQCRMQRSRSYCKCVPHFYPKTRYRQCTVRELECIARYAAAITDVSRCTCELGCSHTVYEVEKLTEIDSSKGPVASNALETEFVSWPMVRYKREVLFGWVDLLVSFGGIAGLFLGFSLLSGVELVYYFTLRACCAAWRDGDALRRERAERLARPKPPYNLSLVPWWKKPPEPQDARPLQVKAKDLQPPKYSPPPLYTQYLP
ncbi:PREDICTED: sodium channel protein Nach-like isoform X2 [Papilio xuthus]|uniref:Sodium channel protein Nach-like isoform X2 n=1 Tax=Papilio xuthus TaxID=66420 RepID=A0AAJ6ZS93_PAPXU|nr:PREDICTED: sodium channel protein Nach-like isoform X2 [Papilio xuthus]